MRLALIFMGGRFVSAAASVFACVIMLLVLGLTQKAQAIAIDRLGDLQALADALRSGRDQLNHVFIISVMAISNISFYILAHRVGIFTRWIMMWGLVGACLSVFAGGLFFFGAFEVISPAYLLLNAPAVMMELFVAGILFIKGRKKYEAPRRV